MEEAPPSDFDLGSQETWDALGVIRKAIEDAFPSGWIMSADQTRPTASAEIEAVVAAIERAGDVLSVERGIGPSGRLGHA